MLQGSVEVVVDGFRIIVEMLHPVEGCCEESDDVVFRLTFGFECFDDLIGNAHNSDNLRTRSWTGRQKKNSNLAPTTIFIDQNENSVGKQGLSDKYL